MVGPSCRVCAMEEAAKAAIAESNSIFFISSSFVVWSCNSTQKSVIVIGVYLKISAYVVVSTMFSIAIAKLSIYLHMTKKSRDVFHNQTFVYGRCNKRRTGQGSAWMYTEKNRGSFEK